MDDTRVFLDLSVAPLGGAGTYAAGMARGLADGSVPHREGVVVAVAAWWEAGHRDLVDRLRASGVAVEVLDVAPPGTWRARLGRGRSLRGALRRRPVDVAFFPRDVAPRVPCRSVVLVNNRYAWEPFTAASRASATAAVGGRLSAFLLGRAARRSAARASGVLAVSQVMADSAVRGSGGAVRVDAVVHHGCDLPVFERYGNEGPGTGSGGEGDGAPVVALIGNVIANKGIETVIDGVGLARAGGRSWVLRVYGNRQDEAYAAQLEEQAARVLGGSVLVGPAFGEELAAAYRGADVLVVGGTFESFCFPLVEGMRSGCVVVAPGGPLVRELCGEVAVTYREGDAASLAAALEVAWVERVERSRAGVARAAGFTWERCAERTVERLRAVVATEPDDG